MTEEMELIYRRFTMLWNGRRFYLSVLCLRFYT